MKHDTILTDMAKSVAPNDEHRFSPCPFPLSYLSPKRGRVMRDRFAMFTFTYRFKVLRVNFMSLNLADVKRIAHLARIAVEEDEMPGYLQQLSNILSLVEEMQAVDTTGIEPMAHAQDVVLRLRNDIATETDRRAAYQAVAPQVEAGLYLVPKVIE
jgi:aspartyl-tRNA(Asn)/glutamyl-tRNA(Gln) amidotransferase subunit C